MPRLIPAQGRSGQEIDAAALGFLRDFQPEAIQEPQAVDVERLFEFGLPDLGIEPDYRPLDEHGIQGFTDSENMVCVVASELAEDASATLYFRSTVAHEIGHAVLHVPEYRQRRQKILSVQPNSSAILHRWPDNNIPIYRNPEWQAHRFAGGLLMPEPAIIQAKLLGHSEIRALAELFEVNPAFVRSRLRGLRLKRN